MVAEHQVYDPGGAAEYMVAEHQAYDPREAVEQDAHSFLNIPFVEFLIDVCRIVRCQAFPKLPRAMLGIVAIVFIRGCLLQSCGLQ